MGTIAFTIYLAVATIAIIAIALLWILALVQIAKSTGLDPTTKVLWVLVVLAFPVVGAIVWFFIGHRSPSLE